MDQDATFIFRFQGVNNFLKKYTESLLETIKTFDRKKIDFEFRRILYEFLKRSYINLSSLSIIWEKYLNNQHYKHTIGLCLRNALLDFLIYSYLITFLKYRNKDKNSPVEDDFINEFQKINYPSIRILNKDIEDKLKKKKISKSEMENKMKVIVDNFPDHFRESKTDKKFILNKIEQLDPKSIYLELQKTPLKHLSSAYSLYQLYSQIEHYNSITDIIMEKDRLWDTRYIIESLIYISIGTALIYELMQIDNKRIKECLELSKGLKKIKNKSI